MSYYITNPNNPPINPHITPIKTTDVTAEIMLFELISISTRPGPITQEIYQPKVESTKLTIPEVKGANIKELYFEAAKPTLP